MKGKVCKQSSLGQGIEISKVWSRIGYHSLGTDQWYEEFTCSLELGIDTQQVVNSSNFKH